MNWVTLGEAAVLGLLGGLGSALLTQVLARMTFNNRPTRCDQTWPDEQLLNGGVPMVHRCGFSVGHGGHLHVCTCGSAAPVNESVRQHGEGQG